MRHFFNVVSAGILLGLSLLAISVLTALYASPWQAATILAVLVGIFTSVSIFFGVRTENQALVCELAVRRADVKQLQDALSESRTQVGILENVLARMQMQLHEYGHIFRDPPVIVYIVFVDAIEEEPPLFI